MGNIRANIGFLFDTLSVAGAAVGLADATGIDADDLEAADEAYLTVETVAVRFRFDGTAPTTSVGHKLDVGMELRILGAENLQQLKLIRDGSSGTAAVSVTLLRLK